MKKLTAPDVVGVTEIASLTGLTKQAVSAWATRTKPPVGCPPASPLAGGPVWKRADMLTWLASTGRLTR